METKIDTTVYTPHCPRCINDWENEDTGEIDTGIKKLSDCSECFVCIDCEHLSECSKK